MGDEAQSKNIRRFGENGALAGSHRTRNDQ
jgi:hypothetical protein